MSKQTDTLEEKKSEEQKGQSGRVQKGSHSDAAYAKFLKKILSSKRKLEETTMVKLNARCSIILQNKIPQKRGDPGSFTIPCSKLKGELGVIKSIPVSLQLADQTTILPEGILKDILVWVEKFVFPVEFIVVDMEVNKKVPLILRKPFLCTGRAILDIYDGQLRLRLVEKYKFYKPVGDTLESCITQYSIVEDEDLEIKKEVEALKTEDQVIDEEELKKEASKPSVELKVLPTHLKYVFPETNNFSMIISA
ncbi:uncharacterized protein LOC107772260 [Nicotiana tabacum]|uniref:Uncharacterized protein LOC107772260 n=1 Tax=Nicotiana tabacum TaxID=4097 RepID=A0A1S3Y4Z7_TOBAC|nr:PREDICTED: uncharacterized protein LOC107772260 [Nicotiana tabacum]